MPTISQIQAALNRCMQMEPPQNHTLSPDASQIATVLAEMNYFKEGERSLDSLKETQKQSVLRWLTEKNIDG